MSDTVADADGPGRRPAPALAAEAPDRRPLGPTAAEAYAAFYRASTPKLVAFLLWQGASIADAAECAQETMAQAFTQWSTLRTPYPWCRTVASRLYARRFSTVPEHPVDDFDVISGAPLIFDSAELDALEDRHTVLALLALLPPRQRQVMAWTYDGATIAEIADALRLAPTAVRSNLYKARETLRAHLRTDEGGCDDPRP